MCRAPKKFFMSVIHIFLKNSYFFKIEKFQFLRKMEDFCHFDALNFLKVKSGEKDKNVSKRTRYSQAGRIELRNLLINGINFICGAKVVCNKNRRRRSL